MSIAFVPEVLHLPSLYVPIVVGQHWAIFAPAVVAADEVEIVNLRGTGGGFERRLPGRGDGTGRQAGIAVGLARRVELQVHTPEVAGGLARAL